MLLAIELALLCQMCDPHFKFEEDWTKTVVAVESDNYLFGQTHTSTGFIHSHGIGQTIKKAQTINISPLRGDHAPEPIDMPFSVLTPVTDVIIPAKFYVD